jgi:hypothetical protein
LHNNNNLSEKERKELETLEKNLASYPQERQEWISFNDNDATIKQIIDKFVGACKIAQDELNTVIGAK